MKLKVILRPDVMAGKARASNAGKASGKARRKTA